MAKNSTAKANSKNLPKNKKRSVEEVEQEENAQAEDDQLIVNGLIDDEADESDGDEEFESAEEEITGDAEDENDEEDSDAEFNELLAEEEDNEGSEDYNSDDFSDENDSNSITDKLSNIKLRTISEQEDLNIHSKYSDGRPRIIKPEINPIYDSDDSDVETHNTIGNIPLSAYDEMPHIGYDINGKRIMRPAKGLSLIHI